MSIPLRANCPRCGLRRTVHPGRIDGLCRDCKATEPDWPRAGMPRTQGPRGAPRTARCGTDSGYFRHLRIEREPPCDLCLRAHADYKAAWKRGA